MITRNDSNGHLDRMTGVNGHEPVWSDVDCPSCGSAPCGPHPDILACVECADDWPCGHAQTVAAELERIAETLHTSCRVDDLMATFEAGARNGVRNELLARIAELRSGVSGTGDQQ